MQQRHTNKEQYFNEQALTTKKFVIPFIENFLPINNETSVLEIGCGEAGNLKPFLELGCMATGIDISGSRIEVAKEFLGNQYSNDRLELIAEDIYKIPANYNKKFDLIIMRDVLEHIPNQEYFMQYVKRFLKPEGKFFLAFPPWYNPFGGHQQITSSKILPKLPFFHLLPMPVYKFILKLFNENQGVINELVSIKKTGISIDRFSKILKKNNYKILKKAFYFINPNYETKFGLKPRKQIKLITAIPHIRNYFVTAAYYLISLK